MRGGGHDERELDRRAGGTGRTGLPRCARHVERRRPVAIALERGGLGLTLVHAALVLDAHGAERWTISDSRQTAGFRLPLDERP